MMKAILACLLLVLSASRLADAQTSDPSVLYRFTYGGTIPTLECSPLRACALMLEAGETVIDTISGDTSHWQIIRGVSGPGAPTYFIKPVDAGMPPTNLIITTNRRTYDIQLSAVAQTPHDLYAFRYPSVPKPVALAIPNPTVATQPPLTPPFGPQIYDFNYRVSGPNWLAPAVTCTDGAHTWLQMPAQLPDLPSLYTIDANGAEELVTVHRDGRWWRIDGVPSKIIILSGAQRGETRVTVEHNNG